MFACGSGTGRDESILITLVKSEWCGGHCGTSRGARTRHAAWSPVQHKHEKKVTCTHIPSTLSTGLHTRAFFPRGGGRCGKKGTRQVSVTCTPRGGKHALWDRYAVRVCLWLCHTHHRVQPLHTWRDPCRSLRSLPPHTHPLQVHQVQEREGERSERSQRHTNHVKQVVRTADLLTREISLSRSSPPLLLVSVCMCSPAGLPQCLWGWGKGKAGTSRKNLQNME